MDLLRSPNGAVVFEAKAHRAMHQPSKWMLSVYVFTPKKVGYKTVSRRYHVLREYVANHQLPDRTSRNKVLQTMCDLAACQLGCEYVLKQAIR